MNYYNEFHPPAAAILRGLIADKLIPEGHVDDRSIEDVQSNDLKGYTQCHFFAGIGGWSYALQLAGWPADRPVWTGSCPCQPFSTAGRQKGKADERHLWPFWHGLIRECRPSTVFGEQVANAIAHGWLDEVADDLEGEGYAVGAAVLPACSVGAPHKRDRLWFVAHAMLTGWPEWRAIPGHDTTPWGGLSWETCIDGKQRAIMPGIRLLADGFPERVACLHGFGNAIVPQVAAEFIKAYQNIISDIYVEVK